jgi:hypothetical protein
MTDWICHEFYCCPEYTDYFEMRSVIAFLKVISHNRALHTDSSQPLIFFECLVIQAKIIVNFEECWYFYKRGGSVIISHHIIIPFIWIQGKTQKQRPPPPHTHMHWNWNHIIYGRFSEQKKMIGKEKLILFCLTFNLKWMYDSLAYDWAIITNLVQWEWISFQRFIQ